MYNSTDFDKEIKKEKKNAKKNNERTPWDRYSTYARQSLEDIKEIAYYTTRFDKIF